MVTYIADALQAASQLRIPRSLTPVAEGSLLADFKMISEVGKKLAGRELYAFDLSALNAASDLRVDTPERIERLIDAVLREPRRMFIEANLAESDVIGTKIRGVLGARSEAEGRGAWRWGAFVDVLGEGRARFDVCLLMPSGWMKRFPGHGAISAQMRDWPGPLKSWASEASQLAIPQARYSIDLSRRVGMSRTEFEFALTRIKGSKDEIFCFAQDELASADGPRARSRVIDAAWQAMRFRDLVRPEDSAEMETGLSALQTALAEAEAGYSGLSLGLPIIAMLALLQADSRDIRAEPRRRAKSGAGRKAGARQPSGGGADGLRVVTLNLEDRGLQGLYDSVAAAGTAAQSAPAEGTHGRARHPVRGHLFLARNGKMTWRRPHWRGSIEQVTIRKVVAPSHR